jgi:trehalose 6-phosphate synthase
VAALRRYVVLFINPIRDGLNLVTLEGPLVNERDGQLVVSREAGVWDQVGHVAHGVNPYDIAEQARILAVALDSSPEDRARHARALRAVAEARTPEDWLNDQLEVVS